MYSSWPCSFTIRTIPGLIAVSSGVWPWKIPSSPSLPVT
ncbi:Uncharacterised protein [Vibrio cholerae]|nr:Uncharacterised protein [Vibrio cholerae]